MIFWKVPTHALEETDPHANVMTFCLVSSVCASMFDLTSLRACQVWLMSGRMMLQRTGPQREIMSSLLAPCPSFLCLVCLQARSLSTFLDALLLASALRQREAHNPAPVLRFRCHVAALVWSRGNNLRQQFLRFPKHPCPNHNSVRVSRAYGSQSILAQIIIPFVFPEHTVPRASMPKS